MALSEFNLIERYFKRAARQSGANLGVGDDCALLAMEAGQQLAVTVDTLVENIHFLPDVDPHSLGYKVLAVSLSDLAAMGAEPRYVTLALTLPNVDEAWLQAFSAGFFELADEFQLDLIGGDTTRGPLAITVQAMGVVPVGLTLKRSGAKVGDLVYVTGSIGDAGLALQASLGKVDCTETGILNRLHRPQPRVAAGLALRELATACIDVSDGLAADLTHLLEASQVGARLDLDAVPLSAAVQAYQNESKQPGFALAAGDDYELCFTLPLGRRAALERLAEHWPHTCTCIGSIESGDQLRVIQHGAAIEIRDNGFQHFS